MLHINIIFLILLRRNAVFKLIPLNFNHNLNNCFFECFVFKFCYTIFVLYYIILDLKLHT